ncbi:hypothetical protein EDD21DRAFT_373737 [Dissophora ornata]|nr:hypothetical protein EDD21DRAFT_373737 [Dissophora ornata]
MAEPQETVVPSLWFEGSVATAVEAANTKGSILLVCLVNDTTDGSESNLFERRFTEARIASELSGLNLVALRLIKDSPDGMMFGQIFPVMIVPSLYLIRNGLLADFMNSAVDMDSMLERIKKAVDGHFQIPPPPNTVLPAATTSTGTSASAPTSGPETAQVTQPLVEAASSSTVDNSTPAPHANTASSSSAATPPPRIDQAQALKDLMKERKLKREKEEREAQKQREIDRRSSSKALSDAQGELKDKQNKKLKDQIEKEKREEAEYKKRVKQALEDDKARRRAEKEKARAASAAAAALSSPLPEQLLTPGEIQSQNAGLTQARNDAAPALAYGSSRLNIRLFDGSSIRNTFKATDTLEKVRSWIDENQKGCEDTYNIVQLIPSRTFTDESKMLRDLELCPSATLVLKKTATASSAYKGSEGGAVPTLLSYGRSALSLAGKAASSAYSTVSYYNPLASAVSSGSSGSGGSGSGSSSGAGGPNRASESARSKKKDTEVHYNGNSTSLE